MGFPRQEFLSGLPFPSLGDLPNPGIEPWSPVLQADSLPSEPPGKPKNKNAHYEDLPENPILRLHPKEISQKFNYFIVPFSSREKLAGIDKDSQIRNCLFYNLIFYKRIRIQSLKYIIVEYLLLRNTYEQKTGVKIYSLHVLP